MDSGGDLHLPSTSAFQLAEVSGGIAEHAVNRFQGVFFFFYQSAQVWGNLVSSLLLSNNTSPARNASLCGQHSCGTGVNFAAANGDTQLVAKEELVLICIYVALGLLATAIFILFLDNLPTAATPEKEKSWKTDVRRHLTATLRLAKHPHLLLLVPLLICRGVEDAFVGADFTQSFVSCTQGVGEVGFVMIVHGVSSSISAIICGQIERYIGRMAIFLYGGTVHMTVIVVFLLWNPENSETWQLALMAAAWGSGDGVFLTQIVSFIGILYPGDQEPAFANYMLWRSFGYAVGYALTIPTQVCINHKLYGLIVLLALSISCYLADEYLIMRSNQANNL